MRKIIGILLVLIISFVGVNFTYGDDNGGDVYKYNPMLDMGNDTTDGGNAVNRDVVVVGDASKQKRPNSILGDTKPEINDSDLASLQEKLDKMNEEQARQACEEAVKNGLCLGIKLNTNFPIIGNCIQTRKCGEGKINSTTVFPTMVGALTKIVMSLVLVACFILIIYAGILWSADRPKEARPILRKVAITILLLGFSGVILRLINPNFFS